MELVKQGDLTAELKVTSNDELKVLSRYIEDTLDELGSLIGNIKGVSEDINHAAENLAATSEETSASASEVQELLKTLQGGTRSSRGR